MKRLHHMRNKMLFGNRCFDSPNRSKAPGVHLKTLGTAPERYFSAHPRGDLNCWGRHPVQVWDRPLGAKNTGGLTCPRRSFP